MQLGAVDQSARAGNVAKLFDQTARQHGDAQAMELTDRSEPPNRPLLAGE